MSSCLLFEQRETRVVFRHYPGLGYCNRLQRQKRDQFPLAPREGTRFNRKRVHEDQLSEACRDAGFFGFVRNAGRIGGFGIEALSQLAEVGVKWKLQRG